MTDQIQYLKKGELLFERGDEAEGLYVLKSGNLEIYLENKAAKLSLALVGPGGVVGEMSLFDHKPRSASAIATTDCELLFIHNDKFQSSLERCPKWFVNFVSMISTRLRNMNRRLQEIQDNYLFSINQLRKWIELLHAVELIALRSIDSTQQGLKLDRFALESELQDMCSLEPRKVSEFIDILAEHQILLVHLHGDQGSFLLLSDRSKLEALLSYLHSSSPEDQSRFCDLNQFTKLVRQFRIKPSQKIFADLLRIDESVAELSQAALDPRKGECRRRHFRIFYKHGEHPVLETRGQNHMVIDLSEQGIRCAKGEYDAFSPGDTLEGKITFPEDRVSIPISGRVIRVSANDIALELDEAGRIPLQRVMIEQRLLIQRGRIQQLGKSRKLA